MIRKITSSSHTTRKLKIPFSFKKTCLYLSIIVFSIIFLTGILLTSVIFLLKPKTPNFSLQTVSVESYQLDFASEKLVVSSIFSLNLIAENPNKVGLSYESSRFHVLSQGLVVGFIRTPRFHQPPLSKNVTVKTRVLIQHADVDEIVFRNSLADDSVSKNDFKIRILGDVRGRIQILHILLPTIKVALDCDITLKECHFSLAKQVYNMSRPFSNHLISLPPNSQTFSKKCSLAILL